MDLDEHFYPAVEGGYSFQHAVTPHGGWDPHRDILGCLSVLLPGHDPLILISQLFGPNYLGCRVPGAFEHCHVVRGICGLSR